MARNPKPRRSRSGGRPGRPATNRHYPRTARLNTLLQEIIADHLDRLDDDEIGFVTVTGVEVDNDLNRAQVFISTFDEGPGGPDRDATDARLLDALAEHRKPIQAEVARQARLRKTPEVVFVIDPAVRAGARIEQILDAISDPASPGEPVSEEEVE